MAEHALTCPTIHSFRRGLKVLVGAALLIGCIVRLLLQARLRPRSVLAASPGSSCS